MLADRTGQMPLAKLICRIGQVQPQTGRAHARRGYLLLIDRENPLSSLCRRR